MGLALAIIDFAILIIVFCFLASLVWEWKSKDSMPSKVTKMVLAATLFALEIPKLVLEVSLGKEYAITIFLLVLWALVVFLDALLIGNKKTEEKPTVFLVIKISECISRDEDDAESECESEQKD